VFDIINFLLLSLNCGKKIKSFIVSFVGGHLDTGNIKRMGSDAVRGRNAIFSIKELLGKTPSTITREKHPRSFLEFTPSTSSAPSSNNYRYTVYKIPSPFKRTKKPSEGEEGGEGEYLLLSIEEIVAMFLRQIKKNAESFLKLPVSGAIFTVPDSFSFRARVALQTAAVMAGMRPLGLICDTTAVGLAVSVRPSAKELSGK